MTFVGVRLQANLKHGEGDAAYHAVALTRHSTLITADTAYHRKTSRAGGVEILADWSCQDGS
jgi:hypothetical protein